MADHRSAPRPEGRRERKRRETHRRITDAALSLFLDRGFDGTTIDDIALAADVSKRSFFDYFPTKESVVHAWQDSYADALVAALAARPVDEPLATAIEQAVATSIAANTDERALAIGALIEQTSALRRRDHAKYLRLEEHLLRALARRSGQSEDSLHLRLVAMIAIGALRVGSEAWQHGSPDEEPELFTHRVFRATRAAALEFAL